MKFSCRFFLLIFLFIYSSAFSQTDSCHLRISLLTCGPGDELYSLFGHTGIRVIDSSQKIDAVFNYGMIDFSDPYFYVKFTRGIMRYSVAAINFDDFMQEYIEDKRSVTEQELQLSCAEKINLFNALKDNLNPQKRDYDYQFCLDNCTTRAKNIIKKNTGDSILFKNILPSKKTTFRKLIHVYLDSANHTWDKFGIDLALGSNLDKEISNDEAMFLPDYLMINFDSAKLHAQKLVSNKKILLNSPQKKENGFSLPPFFLFSIFAIIFIALSFAGQSWAKSLLNVLDVLFFLFLGLLGILIAFLWLGRVDTVCRNNMNILWAWPTHTIVAFILRKKKKWSKNYFIIASIVALALLITWAWLPQQLNIAVIPLLSIVVVRGFFISRKK